MRQYRELSPETKNKISQNPNLHQPRPDSVRQSISASMKAYWRTIPNKPKSGTDMLKDGGIV